MTRRVFLIGCMGTFGLLGCEDRSKKYKAPIRGVDTAGGKGREDKEERMKKGPINLEHPFYN